MDTDNTPIGPRVDAMTFRLDAGWDREDGPDETVTMTGAQLTTDSNYRTWTGKLLTLSEYHKLGDLMIGARLDYANGTTITRTN